MKKSFFALATLTALFLTSCTKEKTSEANSASETTTVVDTVKSPTETPSSAGTDEIVKSTAKDKSGKVLEISFNNTQDTATLTFEGETINLKGQEAGSGIWYTNDHYELSGKGEQVELKKDGKVVFSN